MKFFIFLILLVAPQVCSAIVLSPGLAGSTTGATQAAAPSALPGNTAQIQVGQMQTVLGVCDKQGNVVMTPQNVDRVAMGTIQSATADIITTSSTASSATGQCASMAASFTQPTTPSGIELFGRTIVDKHAGITGYKNKVYGPAIGSFNVNVGVATGDVDLPSYNSHIDANPVNNKAYSLAVWNKSGISPSPGGNDYASSRAAVLVTKEFAYMTVKLPSYKQNWQAQMTKATADFTNQNNSLLSNLGLSFNSPLPADYQSQVNGALGLGVKSIATNQAAAATATQTAAQAGNAAASMAGGGTATMQTALGSLSVPAGQQPLLNTILSDLALELAASATYASNLTIQNNQYAAYLAALPPDRQAKQNSVGWQAGSSRNAFRVIIDKGGTHAVVNNYVDSYSITGAHSGWPCGADYSVSLNTSSPGKSAVIGTLFSYGSYSCGWNVGTASWKYVSSSPTSITYSFTGTAGTVLSFTYITNTAASTAAYAAYLAAKQASADALASMNNYNAQVQANYALLKSSLATTQTTQTAAAASFNSAATGAANANTGGMGASNTLAALDSLISGLGNLLNMANNVTSTLTNIVTLPEVVTAGTDLTKAFDMLANLDGGMQMGDALGTSTEVTNASINTGGVQPGAGNAIGIINNPTGTAATNGRSSILVNARKDTPYRALMIIKTSLKTLRTASAMVDSAIQASGMGPSPNSSIPDPGDIAIPSVMGPASMTNGGVLRSIGVNFKRIINEI